MGDCLTEHMFDADRRLAHMVNQPDTHVHHHFGASMYQLAWRSVYPENNKFLLSEDAFV
jgi:hypothetical protein